MIEKCRMAKATLHADPDDDADDADVLYAEIQRLYRQLQQLPVVERPAGENGPGPSPTYQALEAQIRAYADRFLDLVEVEVTAYEATNAVQARREKGREV
jgi:hypothetical protein